jgi:hypothetical protein
MMISNLPVPQAPTAVPVFTEAALRGPLASPTKVRPVAAIATRRPMLDQPKVGHDERFERLGSRLPPLGEAETAVQGYGQPAGGGDFEVLQTQGTIWYLAQLLGQEGEADEHSPVGEHRDGPLLGAEAYSRAGADPLLYSEDPEVFRLAV